MMNPERYKLSVFRDAENAWVNGHTIQVDGHHVRIIPSLSDQRYGPVIRNIDIPSSLKPNEVTKIVMYNSRYYSARVFEDEMHDLGVSVYKSMIVHGSDNNNEIQPPHMVTVSCFRLVSESVLIFFLACRKEVLERTPSNTR